MIMNKTTAPTPKTKPFFPAATTEAVMELDEPEMRSLWLANGDNLQAHVTKVESDGLRITNAEKETSFISAPDLSTADRVRYGFGTRKEESWMQKMEANLAKLTAPKAALVS
jgi:hypothetical protein